MTPDRTDTPAATEYASVYVAFELSKAKWLLGIIVPGSGKMSRYAIDGGDVVALATCLGAAQAKAALGGRPVRVLSCYEAGFDGHWLHRWLAAHGIANHEIDPSSIEVDRRARRVKTDRIDLDRLMRAFLAHLRGEPRACSVVHVPTVADEDGRRRSRERERLVQERTAHTNRIKGLLHAQGIRDAMPRQRNFIAGLETVLTGDGRPLPARLKDEIRREHERLGVVERQLATLEAQARAEQRATLETQARAEQRAPAPAPAEAKIARLAAFRGIGLTSAGILVHEVFYRSFDNRRQLGGYLGLTGTPYDSGASQREQGIGKAGNRRARTTAIELGWLWLWHQPDSALSHWFRDRVRDLKGRVRRIAIVALARKLMVALWRYLETGLVPTGAILQQSH